MKKIVSILLCFVFAFSCLNVSVLADASEPLQAVEPESGEVSVSEEPVAFLDGDEELPPLKYTGHISDQRFFGEWDADNNVWLGEGPILRYDLYDGLSDVEAAAKQGNYEDAKQLLLLYYRQIPDERKIFYDPALSYSAESMAMMDMVFSFPDFDAIIGEMKIGTTDDCYTSNLDISAKSLRGTYLLVDADMDGTTATIGAREGGDGYAATLTIVANGQTYIYKPEADTYISAGTNRNTNYGSETSLYMREAAGTNAENTPELVGKDDMVADVIPADTLVRLREQGQLPPVPFKDGLAPFGSNTRRTYLRFPIDDFSVGEVTSIRLDVYGKTDGAKPKQIYITNTNNERRFVEDELTWAMHRPNVMCFKETGYLWLDADQVRMQYNVTDNQFYWNTELEWTSYSSRMYQARFMMKQYMNTHNEEMAYRAFQIIMSIYNQQESGVYPGPLHAAWRVEQVIRTLFTGIDSQHMTGEVLTGFLKGLYQQALDLKNINLGTTNQDCAVKVNLGRICAMIPEIAEDGLWETVKEKLYGLFVGKITNSDGSYTEGCANYIVGVIDEFIQAVDVIRMKDGEDDPVCAELLEICDALIEYYMNLGYSNGSTVPYGDGGRNALRYTLEGYYEYIQNERTLYFATKGEQGTEPDYTSRLYPAKALAILRSGWHEDDLCAFINNDLGGSHGHHDDLALDVTAFGSYLLVDAGVSAYTTATTFGKNRYQTLWHNTIQIDGGDPYADYVMTGPGEQYSGGTNIPGYINELKSNKFFDNIHMATKGAYPGFDVHRKVTMIKNKYIIVSDYVIPEDNEAHSYRVAWHPDYNSGLQILDPETGTARTQIGGGPNIKIAVSNSDENEPHLFTRWMNDPTHGEVQSKSIYYEKIGQTGPTAYDSILLPMDTGVETELFVEDIDMDATAQHEATAMKLYIGNDTAYYYNANDDAPVTRIFDGFSYDGEMAYIERDYQDKIKSVAITNGKVLKEGENEIISSASTIEDFAVRYDTTKLELFSGQELGSDDIKILTDGSYKKVLLNGKEISFTCDANNYVVVNSTSVPDEGTENGGGDDDVGTIVGEDNPGGGSGGGNISDKDDENKDPEKEETPPETTDPVEGKVNFTDTEEHWAKEAIKYLTEKGIVSGYDDGSYRPDADVTRAEFVKLVCLIAGLDIGVQGQGNFDDVDDTDWYAPYVYAAFEAGVVGGTSDTTFDPESKITREEMAKMICNILDYIDSDFETKDKASFNDAEKISDWAVEFVERLSSLGIVEGDDDLNFRPQGTLTRGEAAAVLFRLINKEGK